MPKPLTPDTIRSVIAAELRTTVDKVHHGARLGEDLKADHIDVTTIAMAIEDSFDLTLTDDQVEAMTTATVGDVITMLLPPPIAQAA